MALLGQSAYTSGLLALLKCLVMKSVNVEEMQSRLESALLVRSPPKQLFKTTQIIRR